MPQRVSQDEYNEWRNGYITQQLFNFFKLEAELHRRNLMHLPTGKNFTDLGETYIRRKFAVDHYDAMETIGYQDIFPEGETNEST